MAAGPRDAVVTGAAAVSAAGAGLLEHGVDRAGEPAALSLFDASAMPIQSGFSVPKIPVRPFLRRRKDLKLMSRDARLALAAAGLALQHAGLAPLDPASWPVDPEDVGLFMGVGLEPGDITELTPALAASRDGEQIDLTTLASRGMDLVPPLSALKTLPNMALAHVSINLGLMGPAEASSPWATAGIAALQAARGAIARGECDLVLVGAADSEIDLYSVTRLHRMGLLGPGELPGEAGAFVVLEARQAADRRGASILGRISHTAHRRLPAPGGPTLDASGLDELLDDAGSLPARAFGPRAGGADEILERRDVALHNPIESCGACGAADGLVALVCAVASGPDATIIALAPGAETAVAVFETEEVS